jgi:hypothetical protein
MVLEGSVHHGNEDMAEQNISHHNNQEAEKGEYRKWPGQDTAPKNAPRDLLPPNEPILLLFTTSH